MKIGTIVCFAKKGQNGMLWTSKMKEIVWKVPILRSKRTFVYWRKYKTLKNELYLKWYKSSKKWYIEVIVPELYI